MPQLRQNWVRLMTDKKILPAHYSATSYLMNKRNGKEYKPIENLEEAKKHPDTAYIVFEGDWGGIIFATLPVRLIPSHVDEEKLFSLGKALEISYWGDNFHRHGIPDGGYGVYYQQLAAGSGVWGGMGGGRATDGLWMHGKLRDAERQLIADTFGPL